MRKGPKSRLTRAPTTLGTIRATRVSVDALADRLFLLLYNPY